MEAAQFQHKILIVDSEELILRYLPLALKECQVFTARQAPEALRLLEDHPDISVLMADPDASGYPLLEFCRAKFPRMRQVVVGGYSGAEKPSRALADAFRVLSKPCHESDLLQALRQALAFDSPEGHARRRTRPRRAAQEPGQEASHIATKPGAVGANLSSRMKDDLLAVAAHDLRAPLAVIQGYTGILLDSEPGLSDEGRITVERIGAVAGRLLGTVNSLLDLAAVEAGRVQLSLAPCRPADVVSAVFDSLRGMMDERGIRCRVALEGADQEALLDRGKLEQILQNLVSNAIKFNGPGGSVDVTIRPLPGRIEFTVRDTGIGFAPEEIPRAFAKFTRFSSSNLSGTGLGLAIVKAFVALHGGEIRLESTRGQGSAFHFSVIPGYSGATSGPLLA